MQITDAQTDAQSLADLGAHAARLLCAGDIDALASQFGYTYCYGGDPACSIRDDLSSSLADLGACALGSPHSPSPSVSYFDDRCHGVFAVVEQRIPAGSGHVLIELVISSRSAGKHVVLERISAEI